MVHHESRAGNEDACCVASVLGGDRSAFAPLVERYQTAVFNFAYRYTYDQEEARDLAQETFLRAFRYLHRYDKELPFGNWLYAIAANVCRDWTRRRQRRPVTTSLPDATESSMANPSCSDPASEVIETEQRRELAQAIAHLPEDYRACFILFHIQGVSQADIARSLGLPVTVVKNRLYRARLRLRQMLETAKGERNRAAVSACSLPSSH